MFSNDKLHSMLNLSNQLMTTPICCLALLPKAKGKGFGQPTLIEWCRKTFEMGGGGELFVCVHKHADARGSGGMLPQENF